MVFEWVFQMNTQELIELFSKKYGSNPNNWDWNYISIKQKLSEEFIEKFKDKVDWNWISLNQVLSESINSCRYLDEMIVMD